MFQQTQVQPKIKNPKLLFNKLKMCGLIVMKMKSGKNKEH